MLCEKGFHIIEILITLVIVGILATTSLSSYRHYYIREKRLEAAIALNNLMLAMEHYHIEHNSYENASFKTLSISDRVANNTYQLIIQSNENDYSLVAQPLGDQLINDNTCGALILNSLGEKKITGLGNINECW
jgi:prepilin-type N-terminal cleavage/methylation domain-containing protein